MAEFATEKYGPVFQGLLDIERRPNIGNGEPNHDIYDGLANLSIESAFDGYEITDRQMAECCISGLWIFHGFLDRSHEISQDINTSTGSYWHGIMHRREGDFPNAKYWFRQVGEHPSFEALDESISDHHGLLEDKVAAELSAQGFDPFEFVDHCRAFAKGDESLEFYCREVTRLEWWTLFDYCYENAIG